MDSWPWVIWFAGVWISFAVLEGYAFKHPDREWTLSRAVSTLGKRWPLSIWFMGVLMGGLAVHFFWPYANPLGGP
jgi:hypothetical protein